MLYIPKEYTKQNQLITVYKERASSCFRLKEEETLIKQTERMNKVNRYKIVFPAKHKAKRHIFAEY